MLGEVSQQGPSLANLTTQIKSRLLIRLPPRSVHPPLVLIDLPRWKRPRTRIPIFDHEDLGTVLGEEDGTVGGDLTSIGGKGGPEGFERWEEGGEEG